MNTQYAEFINQLILRPDFKCPICGSPRYITDRGNHELTFHCSSAKARFWEYDRGTPEQAEAKKHWDQSSWEVFLSLEDIMRYVSENESVLPEKRKPL